MNRQELYVVPVLAHLQVLAMLATVLLEVRCKPVNYTLTSVMLKMHSSHIRDANQQSMVTPYICRGHSLQCAAALQDNGPMIASFTKQSVLFCGNNMPMLCHCMLPG